MKRLFYLTIILFFSITVHAQEPVYDHSYQLGESLLVIKVMKDETTLGSDLSHNHAIQAKEWDGHFSINASGNACSLSVNVPVAQLKPDAPKIREWAKLEGEVSESQRESIKKNILGKYQMEADKYPSITYQAKTCRMAGSDLYLAGVFTMHGVSKNINFTVKNFQAGEKLTGNASFEIKGTDFGIEPYSAMFGSIKNMDEMMVMFDLNESEQ